MQLNFKNYQKLKVKKHLKKNNFLLFSIGANQNAQNWINIEQGLNKLKLNYYKNYNNITTKIIKKSIYINSTNLISSPFFYLTPKIKKNIIKITLIKALKSIFFTVLSVKLNKQLYTIPQLKKMDSLSYKSNIIIIYQLLLTNLKLSCKISKQCDSNT